MSIFVLKSQGIESMLIGDLGIKNNEGIYIEVEEGNIPKKYRIEKLGGSAVINDKYMRSNTDGITQGKYFEKIAEPLDFEPIQKEKFEMLEDSLIRYEWNRVVKILDETDNDSVYTINFEPVGEGIFNLNAKRYLKEDEIEVQDHKFKEYEENFRGIYSFEIEIPFKSLTKEQIEEIREISNKRSIRVDLDTLKTIVDKYNLEIAKERFHYVFYSKERTDFRGRHSQGIDVFNKNINKIMAFAEATEKWGLADSTLRKLVTTDKLIERVDYRKSGKVWIITEDAMLRLYGEPKKFIKNVIYDEMEKFILNNVEYTYNVALCLKNFISDLGETGAEFGEFFMTEEQEHFKITQHSKIKNEDTDDEEIIITYDVSMK